jgi:hypothetical protein
LAHKFINDTIMPKGMWEKHRKKSKARRHVTEQLSSFHTGPIHATFQNPYQLVLLATAFFYKMYHMYSLPAYAFIAQDFTAQAALYLFPFLGLTPIW